MEKIDAIDANEDTSVINSGCCTGGDEPDEGIKEPNINSSPLECFSPIRTGKLTVHRFVINYYSLYAFVRICTYFSAVSRVSFYMDYNLCFNSIDSLIWAV